MRHGDFELTRLNYVLWPNEDIGPHTRVDIANEAVDEIKRLKVQVNSLKEIIDVLDAELSDSREERDKLKDAVRAVRAGGTDQLKDELYALVPGDGS